MARGKEGKPTEDVSIIMVTGARAVAEEVVTGDCIPDLF